MIMSCGIFTDHKLLTFNSCILGGVVVLRYTRVLRNTESMNDSQKLTLPFFYYVETEMGLFTND